MIELLPWRSAPLQARFAVGWMSLQMCRSILLIAGACNERNAAAPPPPRGLLGFGGAKKPQWAAHWEPLQQSLPHGKYWIFYYKEETFWDSEVFFFRRYRSKVAIVHSATTCSLGGKGSIFESDNNPQETSLSWSMKVHQIHEPHPSSILHPLQDAAVEGWVDDRSPWSISIWTCWSYSLKSINERAQSFMPELAQKCRSQIAICKIAIAIMSQGRWNQQAKPYKKSCPMKMLAKLSNRFQSKCKGFFPVEDKRIL